MRYCARGRFMTASYEAATFWVSAATAVFTLGVGAAGALINLRSAPKRRIFFRMSDPVALLTPDGAQHGLQVLRGGEKLDDPHLVEVTLQSSGRQAITRDLFDEGRPIVLRLGTRVVDLLKVVSQPIEQKVPDYRLSNSAIEIGPGVLAARQSITFSVLVDGQPELSAESPLADVTIGRKLITSEQKAWRISYVMMGVAVIALFLFLGYTQFFLPPPPPLRLIPDQVCLLSVRPRPPPTICCHHSVLVQSKVNTIALPCSGTERAPGMSDRKTPAAHMESRRRSPARRWQVLARTGKRNYAD